MISTVTAHIKKENDEIRGRKVDTDGLTNEKF